MAKVKVFASRGAEFVYHSNCLMGINEGTQADIERQLTVDKGNLKGYAALYVRARDRATQHNPLTVQDIKSWQGRKVRFMAEVSLGRFLKNLHASLGKLNHCDEEEIYKLLGDSYIRVMEIRPFQNAKDNEGLARLVANYVEHWYKSPPMVFREEDKPDMAAALANKTAARVFLFYKSAEVTLDEDGETVLTCDDRVGHRVRFEGDQAGYGGSVMFVQFGEIAHTVKGWEKSLATKQKVAG